MMLTLARRFPMAGVADTKKAKELRKAETTKKTFGSVHLLACYVDCGHFLSPCKVLTAF
jgi:hypothetical protein